MLDNSRFDAMAKELGMEDSIEKIFKLDEEPSNGVISSPNGRIFIEIKPYIIDNTLLLSLQRNLAQAKGDERLMDHIDGKLMVMKSLLDVHDFMSARAGIERAEEEANKPLDNPDDA